MKSIICQAKISSKTPSNSVIISSSLMNRWQLQAGQITEIAIGNHSTKARIIKSPAKGTSIIFSPLMARKLALPYSGYTRAIYENKLIKLGPAIGILTTGYTGNRASPFGMRSSLFRTFILGGAKQHPYIYVFTPEMVDWDRKVITGWYYRKGPNGTMHWQPYTSPLPDVVYERVPNRKVEAMDYVQNCLSRLSKNHNCQIFNQGFFNKWSIHLCLSKHPDSAPYIPETYLSPSIQRLKQMLIKHRMIYLKPSGGSLGLGIFRITYHPKEGYFCRFHQGDKNVLHRFYSLEKLIQHYFQSPNSERFKKYLVQQGIRLIKYENRPVDFRVHMHKTKENKWDVVAIGAKAAGFGSVTTHVRTGGSILPTENLLKNVFGDEADNVRQAIIDTAILIAETLEQQVNGPLGELGMDIGVDQSGKVWLFEVNSKPGRHIFLHPSLKEAGRQSAKYITDFSMKLANFI